MSIDDITYLRRRALEELEAAEGTNITKVADAHRNMAKLYNDRADELQGLGRTEAVAALPGALNA